MSCPPASIDRLLDEQLHATDDAAARALPRARECGRPRRVDNVEEQPTHLRQFAGEIVGAARRCRRHHNYGVSDRRDIAPSPRRQPEPKPFRERAKLLDRRRSAGDDNGSPIADIDQCGQRRGCGSSCTQHPGNVVVSNRTPSGAQHRRHARHIGVRPAPLALDVTEDHSVRAANRSGPLVDGSEHRHHGPLQRHRQADSRQSLIVERLQGALEVGLGALDRAVVPAGQPKGVVRRLMQHRR
jgi:hypothetical protein